MPGYFREILMVEIKVDVIKKWYWMTIEGLRYNYFCDMQINKEICPWRSIDHNEEYAEANNLCLKLNNI